MWAEKEIGDSMTSGLEHIAHAIPYEVKKDLSLIKHKLDDARLVFDWHWIVGCCIALFAAVSSNLGLNLQRLSHLENQFYDPFAKVKKERPKSEQSSMFLRPRWVMGIALMIVASVADFAALSFAAQSLVASLGSLSLVANALIAPMIVREKITSREWKAIALICMGDSACILFGQHKSEVYTLDGLMSLYGLPAFAAYAVVTLISIVGIWCSIYWIETVYAPERAGDKNDARSGKDLQIGVDSESAAASLVGNNGGDDAGAEIDHRTGSGVGGNVATRGNSAADEITGAANHARNTQKDKEQQESHEYSFTYDPRGCVAKYHRFSHAMLSGILGAQSVLLGKSTAELIKTAIAGRGNLFTHFGTYAILVCMFSCIFLQVHYLNEALKRVEATIVVPVFQTFWTLVSVIGGFVFYKEYHDLQVMQVVMFGVGLVFILIGVHMMSQRSEDEDDGGGADDSGVKRKKRRRKKLSKEDRERRRRRRRRKKARKDEKDSAQVKAATLEAGNDETPRVRKQNPSVREAAAAAMADALLIGHGEDQKDGQSEPGKEWKIEQEQQHAQEENTMDPVPSSSANDLENEMHQAVDKVEQSKMQLEGPKAGETSDASLGRESNGDQEGVHRGADSVSGRSDRAGMAMSAGTGGSLDTTHTEQSFPSASSEAPLSTASISRGRQGNPTASVSSPRSDMSSPGGARILNSSAGLYSESETGTDMPFSESDMDDSYSEHDSLLGGYSSGLMHTPDRRQRPQTHSHLASACSLPGMLIDSAARSVVRRHRVDRSLAASASVGGRAGARARPSGVRNYGGQGIARSVGALQNSLPSERVGFDADGLGDDCV